MGTRIINGKLVFPDGTVQDSAGIGGNVTQSLPTRLIDTVYTNGANVRMVTITLSMDVTGGDAGVDIYCDNVDGATTIVAGAITSGHNDRKTITIMIPPGYKYQAKSTGAGVEGIYAWTEWDLF